MIPSAAAVRRRLRPEPLPWRFRAARWYERLVNIGIVGAIGWGIAFKGLQKPEGSASAWVWLWLSVLAAVVALKVLLAFGPVFAGRDRMFWVLGSPVDRAALLLPRLGVLLLGGAAAGAVWPVVLFGVVGGYARPGVLDVAGGVAVGVALVASAVVLQRERVRPQGWLSALAGVAVAALFVRPDFAGVDAVWLSPVAVVLVVVAVTSVRRLARADLAAGAALAGVVRVSVSWLDLGLLGQLLAERRAVALGRVRSARLLSRRSSAGASSAGALSAGALSAEAASPGRSRLIVLVWTDLLRLRRAPHALLVWAGLAALPSLVALGGETDWVPVVHLVAAFVATDRLATGLKAVSRSAAIRRMLGVSDGYLKRAHLVVPATGALLWGAVTLAFTPHVTWVHGVVSVVGAVAVVYRIATRPPLDYGVAAIDFGVMGPVPIGLLVQLSRGPLLLYLLGVLQLLI